MAECEFKKGIFIQRACGQSAYLKCADCGIRVCSTHCRPIETNTNEVLCHACYLSVNQIHESDARARYLESEKGFHLWYSSFRIEHTESRKDFIFDEKDYREFDQTAANEHAYLEDDNGFFDS